MFKKFDLKKLLLRLITIIIYAPIIIYVTIYPDQLPFFIMILLVAFLSLQEMYQMYNHKFGRIHDEFYLGYAFTTLLLLSVFMQEIRYVWENYLFLSLAMFSVAFFIFELSKKKIIAVENPYWYLTRSIFYIGIMYSYSILLRNLGLEYLLYLLCVVWTNDIFAYLIGLPLGRHKLSPDVSPKKSIEGACGAIFGAVLMSVSLRPLIDMTVVNAIFLGLFISIFAQVGDLIESLLKREMQMKDSGTIMPGHGGILDRMDSFILTLPVYYYFVYYFVR